MKHLEKTEMLSSEQIIDKLLVLLGFCGLFSYQKLMKNREEKKKKKKKDEQTPPSKASKQERKTLPKTPSSFFSAVL